MSSKRRTVKNSSHVLENESQMKDTELNEKQPEEHQIPSNWRKDKSSIALLLFLYILQGIPLGLSGSIPLILSSRHVSYKQQAVFSFVYWPFSVKLLWAPIVDSLYSSRIGRRKSWMVPTQYLIGIFMMFLSYHVHSLLADDDPNGSPNVFYLTVVFFMLNFLAATQDIAVDGWALTMLSKENLGYASTCNSVGQTAGYFIANVLFLALESADFCNKYLRAFPQERGIFTLEDFLFFWGWIFLVSTTLVFIFKREKREHNDGDHDEDLGIVKAYKQLYQIVKLEYVQLLIVISMTIKIGFAATDAVTGLKLIEEGVPKDRLALLAIPLIPLQILLPWGIAKYTNGPTPLNVTLRAMPFRLLMGFEFAFLVWITPSFRDENGEFPLYYYGLLVVSYALHQVTLYSMFVATMSFNAQISDPSMGGTYMTLLNTVANLGGNWPTTVALWFVDALSWKSCLGGDKEGLDCDWKAEEEECKAAGGTCHTDIDGYYIEVFICTALGFFWLYWKRRDVLRIQNAHKSVWRAR